MPAHNFSWIFAVDLFQTPISFSFSKRKKRATILGVFCSLFMIIFLLMNFSQSDLFQKKSPYVFSQTITYPKSKPINFFENTLIYFVLADAAAKNYLDPAIFTITFDIYHLTVNPNAEFTIIDRRSEVLNPCSEKDVFWNPKLYHDLGMKNALCLQNKTFTIQGFWDESEVYYAKAQLYRCNNKTSNVICKTPEEINQYFLNKNYFFGTKFQESTLQMNDYNDPFKIKYDSLYKLVDQAFMKRINVFIKNSALDTDDGWFYSAKQIQTNFLRDTWNSDSVSRSGDDPLFQIIFYSSHDSLESIRRYQSISEALASVSGMGNFLFLFFSFFISINTYIQTMNITLNSLYYFPNCETKCKDIKNKRLKIENKSKNKTKETNINLKAGKSESICTTTIMSQNIFGTIHKFQNSTETEKIEINNPSVNCLEKKNINDSFYLEHFSKEQISARQDKVEKEQPVERPSILKKSEEKAVILDSSIMKDSENKNISPLKVRFYEYIHYLVKMTFKCRKKTKKDKLIRKAEKLMIKELDVVTILRKLHEIEKMKLTIFNTDQLMVFNSITKPIVFTDEEKITFLNSDEYENSAVRMSKMIRNYKSRKITTKNLAEAFKALEKQDDYYHINQRLMKLVNENIKQI